MLQVVRHHAVVDHHDLVIFLLVEEAELLDDDVGIVPASGAGGVDAALRHLTAEVIRQGLGVGEGVLADLFDRLLLLGRRGRGRKRGLGLRDGSGFSSGGKGCGAFAQALQDRNGLRAGAEVLKFGDRRGVQMVREAHALDRRGDVGVLVLLLDGRLDEPDEVVDGLRSLCRGEGDSDPQRRKHLPHSFMVA